MNTATTIEGRFEVRLISSEALAQYMSFRSLSVRDLAQRAGLSRAIVGHLRSGKRKNVKPATAKAVAKALDCPTEALFVPSVVHVASNVGRAA